MFCYYFAYASSKLIYLKRVHLWQQPGSFHKLDEIDNNANIIQVQKSSGP